MNEIYWKLCQGCNGSGEGMHAGSSCLDCNGKGKHISGYFCPRCDAVAENQRGPCSDCLNKIKDGEPLDH
jgi:RecJ-like exonuclease